MKDHFDLIAIPKGQIPAGAMQASNGDWYVVLPCQIGFSQMVKYMALAMNGFPPSADELAKGASILSDMAKKT